MTDANERRPDTIVDRLSAAGFTPVGTGFVAFGTVLIIASFTELNWFREGPGFFAGGHSTFSDLHTKLTQTKQQVVHLGLSGHVSFGASVPYFTWLGWVLLVAAAGVGGLAVSRVGASIWAVRWLAAVIAVTGIAVTFLALNLITFEGNAVNNANAPAYGDYLSHSGLGAWAAIAGFLFIFVGSLIPRR